MANLLIVDDEIYAVDGIKSGVDWERVGFSQVFEAYSMKQAQEWMERERVDVAICDVEMPGGSGLELVEWIREHHPSVETVFLTCHAEFQYAKRAVQLGSFDYLLKPVDYQELERTVRQVLDSIREKLEIQTLQGSYKKRLDLQQPILVERFWQDLFGGKHASSLEHLRKAVEEYGVSFDPDTMHVLPILISIEQWNRDFTERDEDILEYGLRNAAAEIIVSAGRGTVFQDRNGANMVMLYVDQTERPDWQALTDRCRSFIQTAGNYFYCHASCYIGNAAALCEAKPVYEALLRMEYDNVARAQNIHLLEDNKLAKEDPGLALPDMSDWPELLDAGNRKEIGTRLELAMDRIKNSRANAQTLNACYQRILQIVYFLLQKKGASAQDVFPAGSLLDPSQAPRSVSQLKGWAEQVLEAVVRLAEGEGHSLISTIKTYIQSNLDKEIGREELAELVHLNPAYLSRLFKKETGESLSEYILKEKMSVARELLRTTDKPISDIAQALGYSYFSHFTKMFKKVYQISPQAYRKNV